MEHFHYRTLESLEVLYGLASHFILFALNCHYFQPGTYTKPVIAPPQVAIGAIGTTQIVPRFIGDSDKIQRAHLICVSWSADHRIIDGVTMAGFSNEWKRYLENPNRFVLQ